MSGARMLLAEGGPAHIDHVVQVLELDDAVDRQVRAGAPGKVDRKGDVDLDCAVLHRRVDARHLAVDDAIPGVDLRALADLDVLGLGFGDLHLGLQMGGIGHPGQVGAGGDLGADFDRDDLQDTAHSGFNVEGVGLGLLELGVGAQPVDLGLLDGELRRDPFLCEGVALLGDGVGNLVLVGGRLLEL